MTEEAAAALSRKHYSFCQSINGPLLLPSSLFRAAFIFSSALRWLMSSARDILMKILNHVYPFIADQGNPRRFIGLKGGVLRPGPFVLSAVRCQEMVKT